MSDWLKVEGQDQVDRSIFSVEQANGELHWLEQMHAAGLYRDEVAYPHLKQMAMEFELPPALTAKENAPAERAFASWPVPRADDPAADDRGITRENSRGTSDRAMG